MDEHLRIVEIGGVKVEVDLRTAKRVDRFRVGDRIKVLHKDYDTSPWRCSHGVIVAFDDFPNLPTIVVCYFTEGYDADLHFVSINAESSGKVEITACNDDVLVDKGEIVARIDKKINEKRAEMEDLERKRDYFVERFGAWFKPDEKE